MIHRAIQLLCCLPLLTVLVACKEEHLQTSGQARSFPATITIDTQQQKPANRLLLGNNVQWVDHGDELLKKNSLQIDDSKMASVNKLGVSVLRYPGGSLADLYQWRDGIGSLSDRKSNSRFHGKGNDIVRFGTAEFLKMSRTLGAEPMITVNLITGSAKDAADWVKAVNITRMRDADGKLLPRVKYWEIGNEPYLIDDNQKHLAITPEEFAQRANQFIQLMKAIDPTIIVGIPLRSDTIAGTPATPIQGFNRRLLSVLKPNFDYVSLHNAYFPFLPGKAPGVEQIYHATLAGSQFVMDDIQATQDQLAQAYPGQTFDVAITEYSSFFTIGKGKSDGYIASLLGALYVADLLTTFANSSSVWMANYWSLSGNWYFGAIRQDGRPRPVFHVLEAFNRLLRGNVLKTSVEAPQFSNPKAGFISQQIDTSYISTLATQHQGVTQVLAINKHLRDSASVVLRLGKQELKNVEFQVLSADKVMKADNVDLAGWSDWQVATGTLSIPARSIVVFRFRDPG